MRKLLRKIKSTIEVLIYYPFSKFRPNNYIKFPTVKHIIRSIWEN